MGTNYVRTNRFLGSINTTKLLSVTSSETLYSIGSGNTAFEAINIGSYSVYYGDSGVLANSGGLILSNGAKMWDTVWGGYTQRFVLGTGGVASNLVIHEYAGN